MIENALSNCSGKALMRVGSEHVESHVLRFIPKETGRLVSMLRKHEIEVEVVEKIADVNETFDKR